MASSSDREIKRFPLRDQSSSHAPGRQSMRIGHLVDGGQGFWVSFDGRGPTSYHTRYWNDANEQCNFAQLQGKVEVDKELELSNFTARKKTTANQRQMLKQKLLIRKVYLQGGVLYEGNVDEIEAVQAERDQLQCSRRKKAKLMSGITKDTTPKKPKNTEQDSKSILDMFKDDACNLPATIQFAGRLREIIKQYLPNEPPPNMILYASLKEAQTDGEKDARKTRPYQTWNLNKEQHSALSEYGDDETSDEEEEVDEDDESDEEEDGSEGGGEDEGHEYDGDQEDSEEEQEVEQEEVMESLGTLEKKDDSDDGDDGDVGVGLHGISRPSEPVPNPDTSGVSTPNKTYKHPWELVYRNYNYKP